MTVAIAAEPCPACRKRQAREPQHYGAWHTWAERKSRRYRQTQCTTCGRWTIWKRKDSNQETERQ